MGREDVTRFVEESDCVLLLGAFMTDINMGIYTANLDPAQLHLCHQRRRCGSATTISTTCCWPTLSTGWPRAGLKAAAAAAAAAAQRRRRAVPAPAGRAASPSAG